MATLSKITIPLDKALTTYRDFVLDEIIKDYAKGRNIEINKDMTKVQPTFKELVTLVQDGCKFENIKLALKFANAAAGQQLVPDGVRGAFAPSEKEGGEPVQRTFLEWIKSAPGKQELKQYKGAYYMKANYGKLLLNSDELKLIHAVKDVQVIEWTELLENFNQEDATVVKL